MKIRNCNWRYKRSEIYEIGVNHIPKEDLNCTHNFFCGNPNSDKVNFKVGESKTSTGRAVIIAEHSHCVYCEDEFQNSDMCNAICQRKGVSDCPDFKFSLIQFTKNMISDLIKNLKGGNK